MNKTVQRIDLQRQSGFDYREYIKRSALESDAPNVIKGDTDFFLDGEKVLIYRVLREDMYDLEQTLKKIKYIKSERTAGLKTTSRIFGYMPRNDVHGQTCRAVSLAVDDPESHAKIVEYTKLVSEKYLEAHPERFEKHAELAEKIRPEWIIRDTPFTSGIVNKNNPLKYHFDTGNFKNVFSCMLAFKHHTGGGHLAMPEFGISLAIENHSLTIFDGQNIMHGVTPIKYLTPDAFRYTIVYYSLSQMWKCQTIDEEIALARQKRLAIEGRRARGELEPGVAGRAAKYRREQETLGQNVK